VSRSRGRLSRSEDFSRVYRAGRSVANRYLVVYYFERPATAVEDTEDVPRLGFSVSKRLGGAVERNRIKRVLREVVRANIRRLRRNMDFVLIARAPLAELIETESFGVVENRVIEVFRKAGLVSAGEERRDH
jgi:ribonuclease P protein component